MDKPANEEERLKRLFEYKILDTDPEQRFDDLTYLAAYVCQTPVAMINLIDANRQWTKSVVGFPASDIPREIAFCARTILQADMLVVEDATKDVRFSENPMVTSDPSIRFYAGIPVFSDDGLALGTLCVLDKEPRHLTKEQFEALRSIGRQVHDQMELRRNLFALKISLHEQDRVSEVLRQNESRFREILETSREGILVEEDEKIVYMNSTYARLYGCETPSEVMGIHISEVAAPEDLERLLEYGRKRSRGEDAPTLYEFRIRRKDSVFVDLEASVSDFRSAGKHYIITFARDIGERKRYEKERENLIIELRDAITKVKTLSGLVPICASCKKIRDDKGFWNQLEVYIERHSSAELTHGICPDCAQRLYPEVYKDEG